VNFSILVVVTMLLMGQPLVSAECPNLAGRCVWTSYTGSSTGEVQPFAAKPWGTITQSGCTGIVTGREGGKSFTVSGSGDGATLRGDDWTGTVVGRQLLISPDDESWSGTADCSFLKDLIECQVEGSSRTVDGFQVEGSDKCFFMPAHLHEGKMTWQGAEEYCSDFGHNGHLASIHSPDENNVVQSVFVLSEVYNNFDCYEGTIECLDFWQWLGLWIGANDGDQSGTQADLSREGKWLWSDGSGDLSNTWSILDLDKSSWIWGPPSEWTDQDLDCGSLLLAREVWVDWNCLETVNTRNHLGRFFVCSASASTPPASATPPPEDTASKSGGSFSGGVSSVVLVAAVAAAAVLFW